MHLRPDAVILVLGLKVAPVERLQHVLHVARNFPQHWPQWHACKGNKGRTLKEVGAKGIALEYQGHPVRVNVGGEAGQHFTGGQARPGKKEYITRWARPADK